MRAIDDGILLDHAAGNGPRAVQLLAECQTAMNPLARVVAQSAETAFGAMMTQLPPANVSPDMLSRILDAPPLPDDNTITVTARPSGLPAALQSALDRQTGGELRWSRRLGGVREIVLDEFCEGETEASIVQLMPGGGIPDHDHGGDELTLILSGTFHDGRALYRPGELCSASTGLRHRPRVAGDEACVCLVVSLAPWRPANPLYGLADRLTRSRGKPS